jgi:hypothetical protein
VRKIKQTVWKPDFMETVTRSGGKDALIGLRLIAEARIKTDVIDATVLGRVDGIR